MKTLTTIEKQIAKDMLQRAIGYTKRHCKGVGLSYPKKGEHMNVIATMNLKGKNAIPECLMPFFQPFIDKYPLYK